LGIGPFFVRRHRPLGSAVHRDAPAAFDHSSAYGQWGPVMVELVEIHEAGPATLATEILRRDGIHHVARFVDSFDDEQRRLTELGWPAVLTAQTAQTANGLRFAFHDARADLGHLLEIYEPTEGVLALYRLVADAARGWDGSSPVREW
ncbi:VOC family protein, partial [Frankia sp. Cr1]|uniref:VOC family protein n=1 Tax=Frankia sp. Cr1 TaxID=3073931 RepID=UPI002AD21445